MWKSSTSVVPVVIGALGSIPSDLAETLLLIGLDKQIIPVLQKTVLLSTYRILRLSYCCMFLPIVPGWYWDCVPDCHCICEFYSIIIIAFCFWQFALCFLGLATHYRES